ncbi:MAG: Rdx family protein [Spirochaetota bacterium]|nr:MAG: Rdx family protein [Spirochaetota bacterium]
MKNKILKEKKIIIKVISMALIFSLAFAVALANNIKKDDSLANPEELTVEIRHCASCGFRSRAAALAEELKKEFGVESILVEGEVGSFNVFVNGELIFSKYEEGRFPESGEIIQKINDIMKE